MADNQPMSHVHASRPDSDDSPPFRYGQAVIEEPTTWASPGSLRAIVKIFALGVAAAVPIGSILGWLVYQITAADCSGDGWCELGAAIFGFGFGVLAGCVAYVVAGVMAVRRYHREGDRLVRSLVHIFIPIGLVVLHQLLALRLG